MPTLTPRTQKYLSSPAALCNIVRRVALGAGEILLRYYDEIEEIDVQSKGDGSPVSLADQEAESYIRAELAELMPDIPFIGEETIEAQGRPDLEGYDYFWVVDPLDGTKEFVNGGDDFTVNIALIYQGDPVLGVVYIPVTGILYAGYGDHAIRWSEDTGKEKNIFVRPPPAEGLVAIVPRLHGDRERLDRFLADYKIRKIIQRSSSLKVCAIAEGKADIYPRFGPTCEWDTAAADAVLRAAGGLITNLNGEPLAYGGADPQFLNPEFIASSFDWR